MADPYRDPELACPACKHTLRAYLTRHVCDGCNGMLLTLADLGAAIHDLTSLEPTFELSHEKPGNRTCPHCRTAMSTCKLQVTLQEEVEHPRPELDRCPAHGLWFDDEELAQVLEKVAGKGFGGGVGRKGGDFAKGEPSNQGGWSAMFKGRSGGWGGW
jgi:Zn-finger nucleic acid-binding protein